MLTQHNNIININKTLSLIILSFAIFFIYFNTLFNDFVIIDDIFYIQENFRLNRPLLENIIYYFTHPFPGHYQPISMIIYAVIYKLSGNQAFYYHLTTLLFHIIATLLIFNLLVLLIKKKELCLLLALFFGFHPMNVEAVCWASKSGCVLYALFFISGLIFYLKYINSSYIKHFWYSLFFFILALFTRSFSISFPVVLIIFDIYYKRKLCKKIILEKLPFFILSIMFGLIAIYSANQRGSLFMEEAMLFSFINRIFIACSALLFYLKSFIFPYKLSIFHYYPSLNNGFLPFIFYLSPIGLLILIYFIARINKDLRRKVLMGIAFFLVSIAFFLQIIPVGQTFANERYVYVPYIGLFISAGFILEHFFYSTDKTILQKYFPFIIISLISIFIYFTVTTWIRTKAWKNNFSLYTQMIENYPERYYGYFGYANALLRDGQYKEAVKYYEKSLHIKITARALNYRGVAYEKLSNYKNALNDYTIAIKIKPDLFDAYFNRGLLYFKLGYYKKAINDFKQTIDLCPTHAKAYVSRGNCKIILGDTLGACSDWQKAYNLGFVNVKKSIDRACK